MASAFTPPMERELSPRLNDGTFRAFIHDTHHAYLLLHRAFQSLPPTVIPNIAPASPLGHGELDQQDYLRPASLPDARDMVPSPSSFIEDVDEEPAPTPMGYDIPPRKVPLPSSSTSFDIVQHQRQKKFQSRSLHYQNPHFVLLPKLLLTVDATQLEATWRKPQKPAISLAHAHRWDQPPHEHGLLRILPNFAISNKIAKLVLIGKTVRRKARQIRRRLQTPVETTPTRRCSKMTLMTLQSFSHC